MSSTTSNSEDSVISNLSTAKEGTGRVEAFSDGVFAIAITLLILEIKVPEVKPGHLVEDLLRLWPSYFGYLTSFLVIGIIWINHHNTFRMVERTDHTFLVLNLFLLLVISFLPFPTSVLAEAVREGQEQNIATILYSGTMFFTALGYNILWRYASHKYRLINRQISPAFLKKLMQRYNVGVGLYAISLGLAFVNYQVSLGVIVMLAIFFLLPDALFTGRW